MKWILWVCLGITGLSTVASSAGQQGVVQPAIRPAPPAATETAPAQTLPANFAVTDKYVLGAEDAILVTVWKEPTLSGPMVIRPDGKITMPLIGELQAAGVTPMQLTDEISGKLKKFVNDPTVTVTVTAPNSQRIYFVGEVMRQGMVVLTPDMTILQAVSSVGGLTPYANSKKMYILRHVNGKEQRIPFDYKKTLKSGNQQGLALMAGDTIVVP